MLYVCWSNLLLFIHANLIVIGFKNHIKRKCLPEHKADADFPYSEIVLPNREEFLKLGILYPEIKYIISIAVTLYCLQIRCYYYYEICNKGIANTYNK